MKANYGILKKTEKGTRVIMLLLAMLFVLAQGTGSHAYAAKKKAQPQGKKTAGKDMDPSQIDPEKTKKLGTFKLERIRLKNTEQMKGNYLIMVVNLSNNEITEVRTQRSGTSGNAWIGIEPIGHTCDQNMKNVDKCIKEKKWAPLIALECGGTYDIQIITKEPLGISRIAKAEKLQTSCSSAGGVLIFNKAADF